jgi:predicted outer membrane protein
MTSETLRKILVAGAAMAALSIAACGDKADEGEGATDATATATETTTTDTAATTDATTTTTPPQ